MVVADVMLKVTLTVDFSAWYASTGAFVVLSVAARWADAAAHGFIQLKAVCGRFFVRR